VLLVGAFKRLDRVFYEHVTNKTLSNNLNINAFGHFSYHFFLPATNVCFGKHYHVCLRILSTRNKPMKNLSIHFHITFLSCYNKQHSEQSNPNTDQILPPSSKWLIIIDVYYFCYPLRKPENNVCSILNAICHIITIPITKQNRPINQIAKGYFEWYIIFCGFCETSS